MAITEHDHKRLMRELLGCAEAVIAMDQSDDEDILHSLLDLCESAINLPVKTKRRLWVAPTRQRNSEELIKQLKTEYITEDAKNTSIKSFRINRENYEIILNMIKSDLQTIDTQMRAAVPADSKLAVTLALIATGDTIKNLDRKSGLSTSSICNMLPVVCNALYKQLKPVYLNMSISTQRWLRTAQQFASKWQFPNCIGVLGVMPVNFRKRPPHANCINLVAIVDACYRFIYAKVDCTDYINDADIFTMSKLKRSLDTGDGLPEAKEVGKGRILPHVLLTNECFSMERYLIKSYSQATANPAELVFNERFQRAKQVVNKAFAMLRQRFGLLQTQITFRAESTEKVLLACCVLHNFLIENEPNYLQEIELLNIEEAPSYSCIPAEDDYCESFTYLTEGERIRNEFRNYFNIEGKI